MPERSTKPYLIRAIHEWCTDSGYTPYLSVKVDENTRVPMEFVKDGEIDLLGYVNVDTNLPEFYRSGSFIGTALHGPVLSKNPNLLDQLLADVSQSAGVALQPIQDAKKADQLADHIVIIDHGSAVVSGTPAELMRSGAEVRVSTPVSTASGQEIRTSIVSRSTAVVFIDDPSCRIEI